MSGDSLDEIDKFEMRQTYEAERIGLQQTNLVRENPAYLSLNLLVQEVCGLLLSATLFKIKIRSGKIKKVVRLFQRSMLIFCMLSIIRMC